MLSIIFLIMLILVLFRAGVQGRENPKLTNATIIVGIITILLSLALVLIKGYGPAGIEMDTILSLVTLVFLFLLKPLVRKLLDLYDLHHQVKLDQHDRTYTKYEIFNEKDHNENNSNYLGRQ